MHKACLLDAHGAASSAVFGGAAGKVVTGSLQRHQHTFLYADRGGDNSRGRDLRRLQSSGVGWARGRSGLYRGVLIHVARWRHPQGSHQARKGRLLLLLQVKLCIDAFLFTWHDAYTCTHPIKLEKVGCCCSDLCNSVTQCCACPGMLDSVAAYLSTWPDGGNPQSSHQAQNVAYCSTCLLLLILCCSIVFSILLCSVGMPPQTLCNPN